MNLLYSKLYKNSVTIELIKWLSIIAMIIDHTAIVFYDNNEYMRFIGRFAFIGFAFVLAHNYRYFTRNKFDYKLRLVNWGTVSQIPFSLIFGAEINILFLLAAGLYTIDAIENIKTGKVLYPTLIISAALILSLFSGYFIFGILLIVLFYCI
ncbi:conjugal transfer protein TraX [Sulfurimonas sp. SWIR-19]|uniref:TraX family protein n=1 Tax=Sulfurimonas sp. SWIR-19 TaxID=2878390 RepID=UPI001CF27574|nr:TraX family protein [Sulfurimonas sp. SWIR-19]UCM99198.1 conjugal transfer protein TraX [Sulfurimonas sp. SWIR-19]